MAGDLNGHGISVKFGGLAVLSDVDIDLSRGEILGLIGPNGAGKTTLINVLSGFQRPLAGRVAIDGRDITRDAPHERARRGIARTFQAVRLFARLSVLDNVMSAALACGEPRGGAERHAREILAWLSLDAVAAAPAGSLPYGLERRVGVARALALRPAFLLLDEPAAGLNEEEATALLHSIGSVRQRLGCGILLIEHNMDVVFGICERVHVLRAGRTLVIGTPAEVRRHPEVRQAYLGEEVV